MRLFKQLIASLSLVLLAACSVLPDGARPVNAQYCDNFLIYDMCARDMNRDGVVDVVYFTDTEEVFMYHPNTDGKFPRELGVHRCAMPMDEDLIATTSRLFYIDESTTFIQKQDIRGSMLLKYVAYMPEVTACNLRAEEAESAESS